MKKLQIVRWEDLGGSRESMRDDVAQILRDNPGRWALVRQGVTFSAAQASNVMIYAGGAECFRPCRTFEASIGTRIDGTYNVFARFVGDA